MLEIERRRLLAVLSRALGGRQRFDSSPEYTKRGRLSKIMREVLDEFSKAAPWLDPNMELITGEGKERRASIFSSEPSAVAWDSFGRCWYRAGKEWFLLYDPGIGGGGPSALPAESLEVYLGLLLNGLMNLVNSSSRTKA